MKPMDVLAERYVISKPIAQGGMARTFLAHDESEDREVVLKVLNFNEMNEWKELELFKREVDVLKSIDYPSIPDYYDCLETDFDGQRLFVLVEEYVQGENLLQQVKSGKSFPLARTMELIKELLETLDYIHGLKPPVVHRDITPKNVVVDSKGRVFLVDFGAVGHVVTDPIAAGRSDTFVGTIGYMPPEQLYGKAVPASDLYSLGVTVIFLLTGKEPHQFKLKNLKLDYRPQVAIPPGLRKLIDQMVDPDLDRRIPTARRALRLLEKEARNQAERRKPVGTRKRAKPAGLKRAQPRVRQAEVDQWLETIDRRFSDKILADMDRKFDLRIAAADRAQEERERKKLEREKKRRRKERDKQKWIRLQSREIGRRVFITQDEHMEVLRIRGVPRANLWRLWRGLSEVWGSHIAGAVFASLAIYLVLLFALPVAWAFRDIPLGWTAWALSVALPLVGGAAVRCPWVLRELSERELNLVFREDKPLIAYRRSPSKPLFMTRTRALEVTQYHPGWAPGGMKAPAYRWYDFSFRSAESRGTKRVEVCGLLVADARRIRDFMGAHNVKVRRSERKVH